MAKTEGSVSRLMVISTKGQTENIQSKACLGEDYNGSECVGS